MRPAGKTNQTSNPDPSGEEVWSSMEDLFWDHMKEVENKWNTLKLNDDIWAKLIYFEQNRRLAKAYVSAPVLTVDGSTHGLDGFRIGLSGIDNDYRSLDSIACLRSIGHGIKLKIDNHGNILIRKAGQTNSNSASGSHSSVWVKDWPLSSSSTTVGGSRTAIGHSINSSTKQSSTKQSSLTDTCVMREIEPSEASYKLFDMRKFRLQLEKQRLNDEHPLDWRQCVSIVSFVQPASKELGARKATHQHKLLEDPCWLMLINIIAIDMIKSSMLHSDRESLNLELQVNDLHNSNLFDNWQADYTHSDEPYRTNSSSSLLFPTNGSTTTTTSTFNYRDPNGITQDSTTTNHLLIASNERIKKLRTANSKYRMSPMKNGSYHRRYQSTQQLSSLAAPLNNNNTIYTTFNSKYINSNNNNNNNNSNSSNNIKQAAQTDNSSTSDYNSVSRSTSSGHRLNNLKLLYNKNPLDTSVKHQHHHQHHYHQQQQQQQQQYLQKQRRVQTSSSRYHRDYDGKMLFSRKALEPLTDTGNKSLSMSAFDLSQRRFDLRSLQSSIKMNYDYLNEVDDMPDYEEEQGEEEEEENYLDQEEKQGVLNSNVVPSKLDILSISNHLNSHPKSIPNFQLPLKKDIKGGGCCCTRETGEKVSISCSHVPSAVSRELDESGNNVDLVELDSATTNQARGIKEEEEEPKVSRSSIASSSSSSGCADNDYFMSQSSSSMSSSTASNERELFSQPASSSEVVCSGSTSDEYDEGAHKQSAEILNTDELGKENKNSKEKLHVASAKQPKASELKVKKPSQFLRKDSGIAVENQAANEIQTGNKKQQLQIGKNSLHQQPTSKLNIRRGFIKTLEPAGTDFCCSLAGTEQHGDDDVDCQECSALEYSCHCYCDCFSNSIEPASCGCEDSSFIFNQLKHAMSASNIPSSTVMTNSSKAAHKRGDKIVNVSGRPNKAESYSASLNNKSDEKLSSLDNFAQIQGLDKTSKDMKQTGGWLERRKYSKILPKFIFSSTTANTRKTTSTISHTTSNREKLTQKVEGNTNTKHDKFR